MAAGNSNSAKGTGSGSNPGQSSSSSSSNFEPPNPNEYSQTNIYVSGFPPGMTEHDIGPFFVEFGELSSVKVLPGRGVGFVHYAHPNAAEAAMRRMQGAMIGGAPIKLAFAKLSNNARQSSGGGYNNPFGMYQGVSDIFLSCSPLTHANAFPSPQSPLNPNSSHSSIITWRQPIKCRPR